MKLVPRRPRHPMLDLARRAALTALVCGPLLVLRGATTGETAYVWGGWFATAGSLWFLLGDSEVR